MERNEARHAESAEGAVHDAGSIYESLPLRCA
jgi:hypothetical protein